MRRSILYIENEFLSEIALCNVIQEMRLPYQYVVVSSIFLAKKALYTNKFDVIILSFNSDLKGFLDFINAISDAQIILLTPSTGQQCTVQTFGMDANPSKYQQHTPFSSLLTSIEHILTRQQASNTSIEHQALITQAKQEWECAIDILPQLVCLLDTKGNIRRINRTVESWHVGDVISAKGLHLHTLLHPGCHDSSCYLIAFLQRAWPEVTQGESSSCESTDVFLQRALRIEMRSARIMPSMMRQKAEDFVVCIIEDIGERWPFEKVFQENRQASKLSPTAVSSSTNLPQDTEEVEERSVEPEEYILECFQNDKAQFHDLVGKSPAMLHVYRLIRDLGKLDTTVLIKGETGTGKELVAKAIHAFSTRRDKPLIAVNCAGLSESILGSQLFGHKRGAFTGAISDQAGFLEAASGGTLFLDEVGDMPLAVQTMLLRALQEREIVRLGETKPRPINVRLLAATQHDLHAEVAKGRFRQDLLYRICVVPIHLPALRERPEDIALLAHTFLTQYREEIGKPVARITATAMKHLQGYAWPGNVRELKAAIEFAVIHCQGTQIQVEDLPPTLTQQPFVEVTSGKALVDEKQLLMAVLEQTGGNRRQAARLLGIGKSTLYRRLADLEIPAKHVGLASRVAAQNGLQRPSFR